MRVGVPAGSWNVWSRNAGVDARRLDSCSLEYDGADVRQVQDPAGSNAGGVTAVSDPRLGGDLKLGP